MNHRICFTALSPRQTKTELVYSDADFRAMWSEADQAILLAGEKLIARADPNHPWPYDIQTERLGIPQPRQSRRGNSSVASPSLAQPAFSFPVTP